MIWLEFTVCSVLMIFFAYHLCKEGVVISEKTRIEEGLIGMLFLAVGTSFPEIATGITAVAYLDNIALGYGDLMGSVIVNLMLLIFLDYFAGRGRILYKVSRMNRRTGVVSLIFLGIFLCAAVVRGKGMPLYSLKGVGVESIAIGIMYIMCLKYFHDTREIIAIEPARRRDNGSFLRIWVKFSALLFTVMVLGVWLARTGEKLAASTEMSETFIGTLFLGVSTSFPEIIVSFAALRAGSIDMAVGNILGSNLFDISAVSILDALYRKGPIVKALGPGEMAATYVAMVIVGVTAAALIIKKDTRTKINLDTGAIFTIGFLGFMLLYFIR